MKSFYAPLLFRPLSYLCGLRILFGDQAIFCRSDAFAAAGGFDEGVPIMEDADLCLKLHAAGRACRPVGAPGRFFAPPPPWRLPRGQPRGRLVLVNRCVATDGRRFAAWGNARGARPQPRARAQAAGGAAPPGHLSLSLPPSPHWY